MVLFYTVSVMHKVGNFIAKIWHEMGNTSESSVFVSCLISMILHLYEYMLLFLFQSIMLDYPMGTQNISQKLKIEKR